MYVYFVTLARSPKHSEPPFPYLQVEDVNPNLPQDWCEKYHLLSAACAPLRLCVIPSTRHKILRQEGFSALLDGGTKSVKG